MKEKIQEKIYIFTDYYLSNFKWYRKFRKGKWHQHQFTKDALQLSLSFTGTFWALNGEINRYSIVIKEDFTN